MSYAAHIEASGPAEGACLVREHAGETLRAPKLIDVVRDALRARHYSRRTEKAYVGWIRRYICFTANVTRVSWVPPRPPAF